MGQKDNDRHSPVKKIENRSILGEDMDLLLGATLYNTEIESVCKGKDKAA